ASLDEQNGPCFLPWARHREERLHLVSISKKNPELLDAGITAWFFFRDEEKRVGKAPLVGFFDFFKVRQQERTSEEPLSLQPSLVFVVFLKFAFAFQHKYQVNVDGTVAAYRFPYLLLGNSLVLKQDSPYYEFFYGHLEAGTHYLPVKRDLSDLLDQIKWAKENDGRAEKMAAAGQALARELLRPGRLYCYYYRVLRAYAEARRDGRRATRTWRRCPSRTTPRRRVRAREHPRRQRRQG
ncbi:unnamed protein product, partial [Tetraodon nigroviridis]